ncbi:hypothetical protein ABC502_05255 [Alkalimonas sp. NCh-2]|uniref:hypothetical protein n=1 Tax=Alkalimonas sp. NCh-2 TaxID=3144846 RepID=UPI0031F6BE33
MSVINQMLKDLDQRQLAAQSQPGASRVLPSQSVVRRWWLLLLPVGILVVLLWFWSQWSAGSQQAQLSPAAMEAAIPALAAEPELSFEQNEAELSLLVATEAVIESSKEPKSGLLPDPIGSTGPATPPQAVQAMVAEQKPQHAVDAAEAPQAQLKIERVELSAVEQQQRLRQQALEAEQAGRPDAARAAWQQLQAQAPQQPEAYQALARMAQQAGYEAGSQYWLQLGLAQGADASQLVPLLAASYGRQQLWAQALQALSQMHESGLQPAELALRATAWQQLGEHQAAVVAFEQLARLEPQEGRWWLGMAISSDALGQRSMAVAQFQRSLQLGNDLNPATKEYIRQRLQELN